MIELEETDHELINPQIVRPPVRGRLGGMPLHPGLRRRGDARPEVTVKAKDRHGKESASRATSCWPARSQHEIDHLNGGLYIDYLDSLEELVRVSEHADEVSEETAAGI